MNPSLGELEVRREQLYARQASSGGRHSKFTKPGTTSAVAQSQSVGSRMAARGVAMRGLTEPEPSVRQPYQPDWGKGTCIRILCYLPIATERLARASIRGLRYCAANMSRLRRSRHAAGTTCAQRKDRRCALASLVVRSAA